MEVHVLRSTDQPERLACQAARNDYEDRFLMDHSFSEIMDEIGGETTDEKMETLIGHLLDHGHYGPFEHPHITFAVKGMSRSCMAQLTRHRHASFDIQSMRYVEFDADNARELVQEIPELDNDEILGRNAEIADSLAGLDEDELGGYRRTLFEKSISDAVSAYEDLLETGVAPENARFCLPIGTKINAVFTVNARMLMHIADMRAAADAQWEIRGLTDPDSVNIDSLDEWKPEKGVLDHFEEWMPKTAQYYNDNLKNRKNRLAP